MAGRKEERGRGYAAGGSSTVAAMRPTHVTFRHPLEYLRTINVATPVRIRASRLASFLLNGTFFPTAERPGILLVVASAQAEFIAVDALAFADDNSTCQGPHNEPEREHWGVAYTGRLLLPRLGAEHGAGCSSCAGRALLGSHRHDPPAGTREGRRLLVRDRARRQTVSDVPVRDQEARRRTPPAPRRGRA